MRQYLLLIYTCFALCLPLSIYAQQQNQTVAPGQVTSIFALPAGPCASKYTWTNDHPEIGLASFGTVNVPGFIAINNTNQPIIATIKAVPAGTAYIGSAGSTEFTVLDLATFQRLATINTGKPADRQIVSPDGKRVYAVSASFNAVIIINTTNNSFTTVDVGAVPENIALSPDGSRLYVTCFVEGSIKVFDTASNSLITSIPVPAVNTVVSSPDGTNLYAVAYNKLYKINATTFAQTSYLINIQNVGHSLLVSPDGKEVYIPLFNSVGVFDTQTATVSIIYVEGFSRDFALSKDGNTLYRTNSNSTEIAVIDIPARAVKSTIKVGYGPVGVDLSADGSRLYVTDDNNSVYAYNTADNAFITKMDAGTLPTAIGSFFVPADCIPATYTITVTSGTTNVPVINVTGTPIAVSTTYGTPSSSTSFNITATGLSAPIQVTGPVGFEMSIDNSTFNNTLTILPNSGTVNLQVYVRLAAYATAGNHSGNVTLNTPNANQISITIPNSIVAKAPLTIALRDAEKTYGDKLFTQVNINTVFNATGLRNGDVITTVTVVYKVGAAATDPKGIYTGSVDCNNPTGANFDVNNYDVLTQPGNIIVNKALLAVTADDKSRVFGISNPVFTYTFSAFVNGETSADLNILPVVTTMANAASPPGQYAINAAGAEAENYNFYYIAGTLTIKPLIPPGLIVPNAFTPNGDGINDRWVIQNIGNSPNCTVDIFSRSGQKVFTSIGYGTSWDGSYKNINAPVGAYYYIIDPHNGGAKLSGSVMVIR